MLAYLCNDLHITWHDRRCQARLVQNSSNRCLYTCHKGHTANLGRHTWQSTVSVVYAPSSLSPMQQHGLSSRQGCNLSATRPWHTMRADSSTSSQHRRSHSTHSITAGGSMTAPMAARSMVPDHARSVASATAADASAASTVLTLEQQDAPSLSSPSKGEVVVAGGGPAGVAAAMVLAKRGWQVTLLERHADLLQAQNMDRAFVYMIDGRGRKLLSKFPGLAEALASYGVELGGSDITIVKQTGEVQTKKFGIKMPFVNHWLPRPTFMKMLVSEGLDHSKEWGWAQNLRIMTNTRLAAMEKEPCQQNGHTSQRLKVTLEKNDGELITVWPHLVIGADGIGSAVRSELMRWAKEDAAASSAAQQAQDRFDMLEFPSPAANIRYKVLQLPPNPVLSKGAGAQPVPNTSFAVVRGNRGLTGRPHQYVNLGLLPVTSGFNGNRTANIITRPHGHEIWNVTDAEQLYRYFERELPQLPVRELIPLQEAQRFAASKGGRFPVPQRVNSLVYTLTPPPSSAAAAGSREGLTAAPAGALSEQQHQGYGVVLLGDARAAFPPDLGQGVNSALEDVVELDQALSDTNDDVSAALPLYEKRRLPDIKALIELMTFGGPYQYSQDKLQETLWALNLALRMLLSKVAPKWFSPAVFFLVQNPSLSYTQIRDLAHSTTRRIWSFVTALAVAVAAAVMWARTHGV